ncbi:hypothetical protein N0V90_005383 [Kalmusia sp. IMI 367209]|nr:hypothetical protein N0V90_005383 [Kalmusia sp. IMI 367209]
MTYTRKQAVTTISVILSLPIPNGLAYATTVLPVISGLLLEVGYDLTRRQERRERLPRGDTKRPPLVIVANTLIFIYSTVVITLLGTHAAPTSGLDCGLRERWIDLYHNKDVEGVRAIQDAFNCCGFKNSKDMAWPFPDKTHKATACEESFGRTNGCLAPWKGEEQRMAGILMTVVGLVFLWQFLIIAVPTQRESWLHKVVPDHVSRFIADEEHGDGSRRAIDYLPNFSGYSDRVEEDTSDGDVENGAQRAIKAGTEHVEDLFSGRGDEAGEAPPENEWAAAGRRS